MTAYNGFDETFRKKQGDQMRKLKNAGKFPNYSAMPCEMCGCTRGFIMGHLENYFDINAFNALCVECHLKLHGRFRSPNGWYAHLIDLRDGYQSAGYTMNEYFGCAVNKEFFAITENFNNFTPYPGVWYENLLLVPVDLREYYQNESNRQFAVGERTGFAGHGYQPSIYTR